MTAVALVKSGTCLYRGAAAKARLGSMGGQSEGGAAELDSGTHMELRAW